MNVIELNWITAITITVFCRNRIKFDINYEVAIFRSILKLLVRVTGNDAVWWRRCVPPKSLNVRSVFQVWRPNNLPFLLHIMIASNLICPKLLWKYMLIISTLFYFGLCCSVHLTFPHVLCSSVWELCMYANTPVVKHNSLEAFSVLRPELFVT